MDINTKAKEWNFRIKLTLLDRSEEDGRLDGSFVGSVIKRGVGK